nr:glycosyltransferase family 4 protein [Algibacter sp.]
MSKKNDCYVITPSQGSLNLKLNILGINNKVIPFKWSSNFGNSLNFNQLKKTLATIKGWFYRIRFNKQNEIFHLRFLKEYQPNIIYSNTSVINIGVKLAIKLNLPHVWHVREFQFYDIKPDFGKKYLVYYLKKSDLIIANSEMLKSYFESFVSNKKIKMIYNGIEINNKRSIDLKLKSIERDFTFLMVGELIKRKSHIEVLRALKVLKLRNQRLKLIIVGEGHLRIEIEKFILENDLLGYVTLAGYQDKVDEFYLQADCFLMSSKHETFGRVTVEAMMFSLPIIGKNSKYNATREIIRSGIDGWLYDNEIDLIDKMEWMIKNKSLSVKMGESGKVWANQNFSLNKSMKGIEELITSI